MQELIEKYLNRTISKKERKQLKKWVLANNNNLRTFRTEIKNRSKNNLYHQFDGKDAYATFLKSIEKRKTRNPFVQHQWKYAAIFIGLISLGLIVAKPWKSEPSSQITSTEHQEINQLNQVVITLADGTKQLLSKDDTGTISNKNGKAIAVKNGKELDFSGTSSTQENQLVFNEIYVPYGQTFSLTLSDGTKVWLNAGTSLKFPQHLNTATKNRIVYLSGEAFFDVTKDENRPFIVNAENLDIEVLGTQFNVSAYKSDGAIATTLVEGSVRVYENSNPDTKMKLTPNYQAAFAKEHGTFSKHFVDTRIYTGWMQNLLIIDNLKFDQILKKLERSHNVTFINKNLDLNNEAFMGEFENESISHILNTISSSTPFNYTIENNVITISK